MKTATLSTTDPAAESSAVLTSVRLRALGSASLATGGLAAAIYAGSHGLKYFDRALTDYAVGALVALFAATYRFCLWVDRPPTRILFRRAWGHLAERRRRKRAGEDPGSAVRLSANSLADGYGAQSFIRRRSLGRWLAHMSLSWGSMLAFAVAFPLVFGWLHFAPLENGAVYQVHVFGIPVHRVPVHSLRAWLGFNALNISAVLVIFGAVLASWRRLTDPGEQATQTFSQDGLPLLLLFAVSATGLALTFSSRLFGGAGYPIFSGIHAWVVIVLLVYIPFGKLFHILQRFAWLAVQVNKDEAESAEQAACKICGKPFASRAQVGDLIEISRLLGQDFTYHTGGGDNVHYQEVCPACRRRLLALNQNLALEGY
jgi:nitrate reductase gamma subunit